MKYLKKIVDKNLLWAWVVIAMADSPSLWAQPTDLASEFKNPPADCRPGAWWRFFGDVMSPQGAEEDIRQLATAGVREVQMVQLVGKPKGGDGVFLSQAWWEVMRAGGREAGKQGLKISPSHMTGWSTAGGPWIPAEKSMQQLVWSTTIVEGQAPKMLAHPETVLKYYRDVAVVAYPVSGEIASDLALKPTVKLLEGETKDDVSWLADGKPETAVKFITKGEYPPKEFILIELTYERPITVRSLMIHPFVQASHAAGELMPYGGNVQAEIAPGKFVSIGNVKPGVTVLKPTRAQRFHLRIHPPSPFMGRQIREIDLSPETKLHDFASKSGNFSQQTWKPQLMFENSSSPIVLSSFVNLSDKMDSEGKLNWTPPSGSWVVLRFGQTSQNSPTRNPAVPGLESDKFNPETTRLHFDSYVGPLSKRLNEDSPSLVDEIFMDSWEGGSQTWTVKMPEEFRQRRGYDLHPYLLALTGRIVESVDHTERFLWDYRRTLADLLADNFYRVMREKANAIGAKLTCQAPGPLHSKSPTADFLQCWGCTDIPMGEYLNPPQLSLGYNPKEASSAAHIYGKPVVTAEDFSLFWTKETDGADVHGGGQFHSPRGMLRAQYLAFCMGVNRVTLTCFVHQADRKQGTVKDPGWGPVLNAPWFTLAKGYTDYLTRCQYLLRQGLFVADICYFYGEGVPNSLHHIYNPVFKSPVRPSKFVEPFPSGYDYDECNAEAILTRMSVKDGRLVLPDGMSYSLLVLPDLLDKTTANPDQQTLTLPVMEKLAEWVKSGLTVVGPKPLRSPSLVGQPKSDERIRQLAEELWGNCDGKTVTEHSCGKGKVVWGQPVEHVLQKMKLGRDFSSTGAGKEFLYLHRRDGNKDIYFVFNPTAQWTSRSCTFRVRNKVAEVWDGVSGDCFPTVFGSVEGGTELTLSLPPYGASFVIFDGSTTDSSPVSCVKRNGEVLSMNGSANLSVPMAELCRQQNGSLELLAWQDGKFETSWASGVSKTFNVNSMPQPIEVSGPWSVIFNPMAPADKPFQLNLDKLIPLQNHSDKNVRYFGGQAVYLTSVTVNEQQIHRPLMLDLGASLGDVAEIKVNDKLAGHLWMPPYHLKVTGLLQKGVNTVKITVGNRWINRLIGEIQTNEESLPEAMMRNPFKEKNRPKDTPLVDSGLIGPVRIFVGERLELKP